MTMLMSSGMYRSPSYQERCQAIKLRRPASMTAPSRSVGARALKRRTVNGGDVVARGPSRIESMPNMLTAGRRLRRELVAMETGVRAKRVAVDGSRKSWTKSSAARKGAGDEHATPAATTSTSSSVVVDIEATPSSYEVGRTSLPPPPPLRCESPISATSGDDVTCIQSPVNSSGVRIVIDSDNEAANDDRLDRLSSLDETEIDTAAVPDGPETGSRSASLSSGSGDDDASSVVMFHCGPTDDVDDECVQESTSGFRSALPGVIEPSACDGKRSGDTTGLQLLSDNPI